MSEAVETTTITRRDIAIAGLSFVVSGVGGALLQRWLVRGKPIATISAIGFGGLNTQVALTRQLVELSNRDSWGSNLKESASYDDLRRRYGSTLEVLDRLQSAMQATDAWLQDNRALAVPAQANSQIAQLPPRSIEAYPYLTDNLFGSALYGALRRGEIAMGPLPTQVAVPSILSLSKSDEAWIIIAGKVSTRIPTRRLSDEDGRIAENLAWSMSRGVWQNLRHYAEQFLNASRRDLLTLQAVEQALREVLVRESRMSALVTLQNLGDTPVIFAQEYVLLISTPKYSRRLLLVSDTQLAAPKRDAVLSALAEPNSEPETSQSVAQKVDDKLKLLPATPAAEHHVIAPNSIKVVSLRSPEPVGKDAEQIFSLYQNEFVECQITASLIDGTKILTPSVPFGKDIELKRRQALVGQ